MPFSILFYFTRSDISAIVIKPIKNTLIVPYIQSDIFLHFKASNVTHKFPFL